MGPTQNDARLADGGPAERLGGSPPRGTARAGDARLLLRAGVRGERSRDDALRRRLTSLSAPRPHDPPRVPAHGRQVGRQQRQRGGAARGETDQPRHLLGRVADVGGPGPAAAAPAPGSTPRGGRARTRCGGAPGTRARRPGHSGPRSHGREAPPAPVRARRALGGGTRGGPRGRAGPRRRTAPRAPGAGRAISAAAGPHRRRARAPSGRFTQPNAATHAKRARTERGGGGGTA